MVPSVVTVLGGAVSQLTVVVVVGDSCRFAFQRQTLCNFNSPKAVFPLAE